MKLTLEKPFDHYWIICLSEATPEELRSFDQAVLEGAAEGDRRKRPIRSNHVQDSNSRAWEYVLSSNEDKVFSQAQAVADKLKAQLEIQS